MARKRGTGGSLINTPRDSHALGRLYTHTKNTETQTEATANRIAQTRRHGTAHATGLGIHPDTRLRRGRRDARIPRSQARRHPQGVAQPRARTRRDTHPLRTGACAEPQEAGKVCPGAREPPPPPSAEQRLQPRVGPEEFPDAVRTRARWQSASCGRVASKAPRPPPGAQNRGVVPSRAVAGSALSPSSPRPALDSGARPQASQVLSSCPSSCAANFPQAGPGSSQPGPPRAGRGSPGAPTCTHALVAEPPPPVGPAPTPARALSRAAATAAAPCPPVTRETASSSLPPANQRGSHGASQPMGGLAIPVPFQGPESFPGLGTGDSGRGFARGSITDGEPPEGESRLEAPFFRGICASLGKIRLEIPTPQGTWFPPNPGILPSDSHQRAIQPVLPAPSRQSTQDSPSLAWAFPAAEL